MVNTNGVRMTLRREQKNVVYTMELIARFTKRGGKVLDLFSGTGTAGAAVIGINRKLGLGLKIVSVDNDGVCVRQAMARAQRLLSRTDLPISNSYCVEETGGTKSKKRKIEAVIDTGRSCKKTENILDMFELSGGEMLLDSLEKVPEYIDVFGTAGQEGRSRLDIAKLKAAELSLEIKKSTVAFAGLGVFAKRNFTAGATLGAYAGEVLTLDRALRRGGAIERLKNSVRLVGSECMVYEQDRCWDGSRVIIVGSEECPLTYINHTSEGSAINAALYEVFDANTGSVKFNIVAEADVGKGEEFFMDYGNHFFQCEDDVVEIKQNRTKRRQTENGKCLMNMLANVSCNNVLFHLI